MLSRKSKDSCQNKRKYLKIVSGKSIVTGAYKTSYNSKMKR